MWFTAMWKFFFSFISQWARASSFSRMHDHNQSDTSQSVGLLWTSDKAVADASTWQQKHFLETDIHVSGGIRICKPIMRAAAYPRLGPCGHWDWRCADILVYVVEWHHVLPCACERDVLLYI